MPTSLGWTLLTFPGILADPAGDGPRDEDCSY